MKLSEVFGAPKPRGTPLPLDVLDKPFAYKLGKGLCRKGPQLWLNHRWGKGWKCTRCGALADIKGLLK